MRNQHVDGRADQRGMASIIITLVTMVIISLIVIGFAVVSQREQRQSLDQLLSSQAFYAAESGVEDAKAVIQAAVRSGQPVVGKDDCSTNNTGDTYPTGMQTIVDQGYDVRYTCLRVDPAPTSLQFDGVSQDAIVIPVNTPQPITSVRITWRPSTASGSPMAGCPAAAANSFRPQTSWNCGHGVLRADAVPTNNLQTATLSNSLLSAFFVPTTSGASGQLAYTPNVGRANVLAADCSANTTCTATINALNGTNSLSLRLSSVYQSSNITVEALTGSNPQPISGVQARIDSTGKASDVLRRIQVRLPIIQTGGLLPNGAITSNGGICKRFGSANNYFTVPAGIVSPDTSNPMCQTASDGSF